MELRVDASPLFAYAHFEIGEYEGEFDEDGNVEIETNCCCGTWTTTRLTVDWLQELVNEAKKFRDRRIVFNAAKERA